MNNSGDRNYEIEQGLFITKVSYPENSIRICMYKCVYRNRSSAKVIQKLLSTR